MALLAEFEADPLPPEEPHDEQAVRIYTSQFPYRFPEGKRDERFYLPAEQGGFRHELIDTVERFREVTDGVSGKIVAGDTETNGLVFYKHRIVGFSFALSAYDAYYVPIRHLVGRNCPEEEILPLIFAFHERNNWLYYNWLFDGLMWKAEGMDTRKVRVNDVLVWVYNCDNNIKRNGLKGASEWYLGRKYQTFEEVVGSKKKVTFDQLKPEDGEYYACADAACTYGLFQVLHKRLAEDYPEPFRKYRNGEFLSYRLDNRLANAMVNYYLMNEIHLDHEAMARLAVEIRRRRDELAQEIYAVFGVTAGDGFNIGSKQQIAEALRRIGLDTGMRTDTGLMKVDKNSLPLLDHPVGSMLLEYSSLTTQLNNYIDKLSQTPTGRINYKIFNTPTGRLASGQESKSSNAFFLQLNYQNLTKPKQVNYRAEFEGDDPKNPELVRGWRFTQVTQEERDANPEAIYVEGFDPKLNIRNAVTVPNRDRENWYFVGADYSQEELRLIGGISGDPVYLEAFEKKQDIYKTVGSRMYGIPYEEVTGKKRKTSKTCVLGLNYEGSKFTLMRNAKMPEDEAEFAVTAYRRSVAHLERWKQRFVEQVNRGSREGGYNGVVRTLYGRPRRLNWWLWHPEEKYKKKGRRFIVNTQIQGTGADVMRIVLCELYEKLFSKYPDRIKFVGCVHDEIDFVVRKDAFDELVPQVKEIMEIHPPNCRVKLLVEFEVGWSYGSMWPFTQNEEGLWVPKPV